VRVMRERMDVAFVLLREVAIVLVLSSEVAVSPRCTESRRLSGLDNQRSLRCAGTDRGEYAQVACLPIANVGKAVGSPLARGQTTSWAHRGMLLERVKTVLLSMAREPQASHACAVGYRCEETGQTSSRAGGRPTRTMQTRHSRPVNQH